MAIDKNMREIRKGALELAKAWAEHPDRVLCDGLTSQDVLRKVRNRIWVQHGQEELDALESEIDDEETK